MGQLEVGQICMTAGIGEHLFCLVKINGQHFKALIDSGANMNAMAPAVAARCKAQVRRKRNPYPLTLVDGEPHSMNQVDEETEEVTMTLVRGHLERVVFDVIPIGHHQVILGSPWLKTHNPMIDWRNHTIRMNGCCCIAVAPPKLNREK